MTDIVERLRSDAETARNNWPEVFCVSEELAEEAADEIETLRKMMLNFLVAWKWHQEDAYDREQPHDCIREMNTYMEKLGYKIDQFGFGVVS